MFRYIPFDDDPFDSFFGYQPRPRRSFPRRAIRNGDSDDERRVTPFGGYPGYVNRWYDDFGTFRELEDVLQVKEDDDRFLVRVKDKNASLKDLLVNYHKKENELVVTVSHNYNRDDGAGKKFSSTSSETSSVAFSKPVSFEDISADVEEEGIVINVPKAGVDESNIHKVNINKAKQEGKA